MPVNNLSAAAGIITRQALSATALENALAWRQGQIVFDGRALAGGPCPASPATMAAAITATADAAKLRVGGRFSLDDLDGFFAALEEVLPVRVTHHLNGTEQVDLRPAR